MEYNVDIFASSNITSIWMSQKGVCWRAGFVAVPAVFLVKTVFCRRMYIYLKSVAHFCMHKDGFVVSLAIYNCQFQHLLFTILDEAARRNKYIWTYMY